MIAIVAVAEDGAIGKDGKLLFSLKTDMRRFRTLTSYMTVIMGRKTLESFPGGKPLKNRRNIVLSRSAEAIEGAELARSAEEAMTLVKDEKPDEVYLIGGAGVYREMLPYCNKVYLTRVAATVEADAYFPELKEDEWKLTWESECMEENGLRFRYQNYERI